MKDCLFIFVSANQNQFNISFIIYFLAKDFVLKINSTCIYSLCDLIRHVWNLLKSFFHTNKLTEIFAEEDDKLSDKLTNLILEIKRQIYVSCFVLELIRAYVQIFLPASE